MKAWVGIVRIIVPGPWGPADRKSRIGPGPDMGACPSIENPLIQHGPVLGGQVTPRGECLCFNIIFPKSERIYHSGLSF